MKFRLATLLMLAAITGCDRKEQGSQTENPGPPNPAVQPGPTPSDTNNAPRTETGLMRNDIPPAGNTAPGSAAATQATVDKMKSITAEANDRTKDFTANLSDQAQHYLDEVNGYTKDKKFDLADASMAKLQALKDKLPAEWQSKIDSAQQSLENAKKG